MKHEFIHPTTMEDTPMAPSSVHADSAGATDVDTGVRHDRPATTPRWVKVSVGVLLLLVLVVIILHLTGNGFGRHLHMGIITHGGPWQ